MIRLFYVALFISCLIPGIGHSQGKYDRIDQVVAQLGAMPDKTLHTIADTISRKFSDKQDKTPHSITGSQTILPWMEKPSAQTTRKINRNKLS